MYFRNPPSIDEPLKMKEYLKNFKEYIFSQEIITEKIRYLSYVNSIFPDAQNDIKLIIYDGIFSIAQELNPKLRECALTVLSETAPILKDWVFDSLSKGKVQLTPDGKPDVISSSTTRSFKQTDLQEEDTDKIKTPLSVIGTIGMCLEDENPEVRALAIAALVKSVTKSDVDHASQIITVITQLTNDSSPKVRTAAIKGLYKTSSIVGHLVQLEDSQLRLILPIIVDKESHQNDRIEVLKFIERLKVTSYDQMAKISVDLSEASDRCDWGILLLTAYTFGRHNPFFARLFSCDNYGTLWASYYEFFYPARKVLIPITIVLGAFDEERFPLQYAIQKIGTIFTPLLMLLRKQYEKNNEISDTEEEINLNKDNQKDIESENEDGDNRKFENSRILLNDEVIVNGGVDLKFLKSVIEGNELVLREILALNDVLKDSCDFVLEKAPESTFINEEITVSCNKNGFVTSTSIPQSPSSRSSFNIPIVSVVKNKMIKYRGQFTLPIENSKYNPIFYKPRGNFSISICGKVTPFPKNAILLLLMKTPIFENNDWRSNDYKVEMNQDGTFLYKPTINLPPFSPFCKVELTLFLQFENSKEGILISERPHELWFKMSQ